MSKAYFPISANKPTRKPNIPAPFRLWSEEWQKLSDETIRKLSRKYSYIKGKPDVQN